MNEKYSATYEECMGCAAERCRGAGFLDIRLANANEALLCSDCVSRAVDVALARQNGLTNLRLQALAKQITRGLACECPEGYEDARDCLGLQLDEYIPPEPGQATCYCWCHNERR